MNPQQLSTLTPALLWVVFATGIFGLLATGSGTQQTTGAAPSISISMPLPPASPALATASQPSSMPRRDLSQNDLQASSASHATSHEAKTELSVADVAHAPMPSTEPAPVQIASADPSDIEPVDANKATKAIEIVGECEVVDICIDRYLWALYQRTPKEDTIKKLERRQVIVKRKVKGKRKTVTVSKAFTKLVDQDFGWKDPKAAERAGMSMMDYVIGGMDRVFRLKLFRMLHAAEAAGLSPGITSGFRDDYRQSIASGLKAASNRSYHGGSLRGGYGHGLAADVVSVEGRTRNQRHASSEKFWKWIDAHGKEFGIGRPYLDRDPPHVAPIDGEEYAKHNRGSKQAASGAKKTALKRKANRVATRDHLLHAKRPRTAAVSARKRVE